MACKACEENKKRKLARAALDTAKALATGQDAFVSEETAHKRRQECELCEHVIRFHAMPKGERIAIGMLDKCGQCGCNLYALSKSAVSSCELSKWDDVK